MSRTEVLLIICILLSLSNDLLSIIKATLRAYMMGHLGLMALWALYKTRCLQLPVCATPVTTGLRQLPLWYCHYGYTSLNSHLLFELLQNRKPRIYR